MLLSVTHGLTAFAAISAANAEGCTWKSGPIASHSHFFVLRVDTKPRQTLSSFFGRQRMAIQMSVQEVDRYAKGHKHSCIRLSRARQYSVSTLTFDMWTYLSTAKIGSLDSQTSRISCGIRSATCGYVSSHIRCSSFVFVCKANSLVCMRRKKNWIKLKALTVHLSGSERQHRRGQCDQPRAQTCRLH